MCFQAQGKSDMSAYTCVSMFMYLSSGLACGLETFPFIGNFL